VASDRATRVLERFGRAAGASGRLRFDRFLEIALYDPDLGYYTSSRPRLGREGDFYTAAHVHPLFAQALAERVFAEFVSLGRPNGFRVVEMGPGDGTLAVEVARAIEARLPAGESLEYVLVERSRAMLARATDTIAAAGTFRSVQWRSSASLAADGPFRGVVIANEFLDALPFRRLLWRDGAWRELEVDVSRAPFRWVEGSAFAEIPSPPLSPGPREGAIAEIGLEGEAFLREVADHLRSGSAVLLDYGEEEAELIGGRPSGTLTGLRDHRAVADPLTDPGEVDLSAFVNFSRLRAAARSSGLVETAYRPQAEALAAWGFQRRLDAELASAVDAESRVRLQLAAKNLMFGFGNFRVLELAGALRS
jgi:SAM-dependent MidA family methyltransferase